MPDFIEPNGDIRLLGRACSISVAVRKPQRALTSSQEVQSLLAGQLLLVYCSCSAVYVWSKQLFAMPIVTICNKNMCDVDATFDVADILADAMLPRFDAL